MTGTLIGVEITSYGMLDIVEFIAPVNGWLRFGVVVGWIKEGAEKIILDCGTDGKIETNSLELYEWGARKVKVGDLINQINRLTYNNIALRSAMIDSMREFQKLL